MVWIMSRSDGLCVVQMSVSWELTTAVDDVCVWSIATDDIDGESVPGLLCV